MVTAKNYSLAIKYLHQICPHFCGQKIYPKFNKTQFKGEIFVQLGFDKLFSKRPLEFSRL